MELESGQKTPGSGWEENEMDMDKVLEHSLCDKGGNIAQ